MSDKSILQHEAVGTTVEEIHLALLQAIPEGMCFTDQHGAVRFWNEAAEAISGFSVAEAVCSRHSEDVFFISGPDGQPVKLDAAINGSYFLRHKDGHYVPVLVRRVPVNTESNLPMGTLDLFVIPEGSIARAETRREDAEDDQPTWMKDAPPDAFLHWANQGARPAAILLIQIDAFDETAQRLGPEAAEKLFAMLDRTTGHCLKDGDSYRSLADGVVLASVQNSSRQGLHDLAEKIRALIQSTRIQWWGEAVTVTVSIGATQVHPHDTVADAIGRAEDCVTKARAAGGNKIVQSED